MKMGRKKGETAKGQWEEKFGERRQDEMRDIF